MDMMCIDLGLENRFDDRKRTASKKPKQPENKKKKVTTEDDYEDDDSAYHFIAYVPVDGEVWNLDGLDRQPQKLGSSFSYHVLDNKMLIFSRCLRQCKWLASCSNSCSSSTNGGVH